MWNYLKKFEILQTFALKIEICVKLHEKSKFFGNLPWKIVFFCKITIKNRNSSEICLENRNLLWSYMKKIEIFRKFALKNRFFVCKIAWKKSKFFGNFPRKSNIFDQDPRPPDFKPDWRRCYSESQLGLSTVVDLFEILGRQCRTHRRKLVKNIGGSLPSSSHCLPVPSPSYFICN